MKQGRSLQELAAEITRQAESKKDYVAQAKVLELDDQNRLHVGDREYPVNDLAHRQIGDHLKIPAVYYDRMRKENPALLANNVNAWFKESKDRRMVRTLDGNVRAFLSDRYRPLDNFDLAQAVLPAIQERNLLVLSSEVTERRLYIKAVDAKIERDVPKGRRMGDGTHTIFDTVVPGIVITNSEVGLGSLGVETAVYTRACTNLAIMPERSLNKYHTGSRAELGDEVYKVLSDDTRRVTDEAMWKQARDIVKAALSEQQFDAYVKKLAEAGEQKIDGDVIKVVEVVQKRFQWSDDQRGNVLRHLIEGGDLSKYGLANAVTRTAQDLESYDDATEFERHGGKVIEIVDAEWREIAQAA